MTFIATAVVVTATVASGAMAYRQSEIAAAAQENQAKQATLLAANRAQVARNNAIARAQDEQFQAGVSQFNKQESLMETSRKADLADRQIAAQLASSQSKDARRGLAGASFEDLLNAESLELESAQADLLFKGGQSGYQFGTSAELGGLRARRSIEMGQYESGLAIAEGQYQSSNLKAQAQATRIGGYADAVGGVAGAASGGASTYSSLA